MKKAFIVLVTMLMIVAVSVCPVGAYSLPEGIVVSAEEGVSLESIDSTQVYGYVGDADLSGVLNIRDATHIQKAVANLIEIDAEAQMLADADLSGEVNVKDATAVQKWLVGFSTEAPVYHAVFATGDEVRLELVEGNWVGSIDVASDISSKLYYSGNYPGFDFKNIEIGIRLEFNHDMTYSIYYDDSTFDSTLAQFRATYADGMQKYFEKYISANKLDTTVEEMLKTSGFNSIEEFTEDAVDEKMVKNLIEFESSQGKYVVSDGGTIYVSDSTAEESELKGIVNYEWYDVNLVIKGGTHLLDSDKFPVMFERAE